jgi:hypothetical protein
MLTKSTDDNNPGSGVRLTFRLNVVAQTPRRGDGNSPHSEGEKTSSPVLNSVIIAAEVASSNALLKHHVIGACRPPARPCRPGHRGAWRRRISPDLSVMAEALLSQRAVSRFLGAARLLRFVRAGWLKPARRSPSRVLYRVADVHAALRRLERGEACPPDQLESARTNGSAIRHGRGYQKKVRQPPPGLDAIELDWSAVKL